MLQTSALHSHKSCGSDGHMRSAHRSRGAAATKSARSSKSHTQLDTKIDAKCYRVLGKQEMPLDQAAFKKLVDTFSETNQLKIVSKHSLASV